MAKIIYFFIFVLMDESLIYIIILIVIYVIRFFLKGKEETPAEPPYDYEQMDQPDGPRRPSSFEELLEELGKKNIKDEEVEVEEYQPTYESLEDPYYQHTPLQDAEARSVYEKSVSQTKKFKTIDEQVDIEQIEIRKIDEPIGGVKKETSSRYAKLFRNPQRVKDAIVMTEILNRKYD